MNWKKNKSFDDWYEFTSTLLGGFPEPQTFGNRAHSYLLDKTYDIVIDNQSISYGALKIQDSFPLVEIMHHPISKDYYYDLKFDTEQSLRDSGFDLDRYYLLEKWEYQDLNDSMTRIQTQIESVNQNIWQIDDLKNRLAWLEANNHNH